MTLKYQQDGLLDWIDGTYAMCPYISNRFARKTPELPSLYENDDCFIRCRIVTSGTFFLSSPLS